MTRNFDIKITIDGNDARREAGKLRLALEAELARIEVQGAIDIGHDKFYPVR